MRTGNGVRFRKNGMLRVTELCRSFRGREILGGISFTAEPGEILGISGDNGTGKTTLLSVIAGVIRPDSGEVWICGENALRNRRVFSKYVSFVPQDDPVLSDVSVMDNLKLWGKPDDSLIARFGLTGVLRDKAGTLSGGMIRRLSIACALEKEFKVLVMDEPCSGLDREQTELVRDLIMTIRSEGRTVIMSSHLGEDLDICDRVMEIGMNT